MLFIWWFNFVLGIALLSKQKTFTAKMVKIVREKMLKAFEDRDVAKQKFNQAQIKACILNGFDPKDQLLYKAVMKLKNKKVCCIDSVLCCIVLIICIIF